jgi:hypothetical protein
MKNITLAIDDEILEKARVVAAEKRTTVNAMVREFLVEVAGRDQRREEARRAPRSDETFERTHSNRLPLRP